MTKRDKIQAKFTQAIKNNNLNGIINIAPRVGKTKVVLDALDDNGKYLVSVPYIYMLETWEEEQKKWGSKANLTIMHRNSVVKEDLSQYDAVLYDEAHLLSDATFKHLYTANKLLFISGSYSKSTLRNYQRSFGLKLICDYDIEDAIADGIIADYKIKLIGLSFDSPAKKHKIKVGKDRYDFKTSADGYKYLSNKFNYWKDRHFETQAKRDKFIKMNYAGARARLLYQAQEKIDLANYLLQSKERVLIFTALKKVANQLSDHPYHSSSKDDTLERFINQDINELAVCDMVSMGVTIPNLKLGLFHQMKSSQEMAVQRVLRMLNLDNGQDAHIDILYYKDTQDEIWARKSVELFSKDKIEYYEATRDKPTSQEFTIRKL